MKHTARLKTDAELIADYTNGNNEALEALLERHSCLLKKLAYKYQSTHPNTIFEDCYQNAIVGAILAFKRFKPNSDAKLSTFLYSTVHFHLLSTNDSESFVLCPSNLREVKSYFAGKFTEERKRIFEQKHNLKDENDIQSFKKKYSLIAPNSVVISDELFDIETSGENHIVDQVMLNIALDNLSEDDRQIVCLLLEGHSILKISRMISATKYKISDKQIKNKLRSLATFIV